MIRLLRPYRGWATKEQRYECSEEISLASGAEAYLVEKGWAEYVGKEAPQNDYENLGYRELQALCKKNDLSAAGSTEDLIERLVENA